MALEQPEIVSVSAGKPGETLTLTTDGKINLLSVASVQVRYGGVLQANASVYSSNQVRFTFDREGHEVGGTKAFVLTVNT